MKKILLVILILTLCILMFGCADKSNQNDTADKKAVESLVTTFGQRLQNVPLLGTPDIVKKSMEENYGGLVSQKLIDKWISDPQNAPGRLTSSPWPDRIDILSTTKISNTEYKVKGEIIEITSVEKEKGEGYAAKRPITLDVKKINGKWIIDDVILGPYENSNSVVYKNTDYGFDFNLPITWKGYTIESQTWEGLSIKEPNSSKVVQTGPKVIIKNPQFAASKQRQDIPIMVFTTAQWNSLKNEEFSVGAAPIPPSELGRNNKYVFALPARYNYAFPIGYEEVEQILKNNPLKPFDVK